MEKAKNLFHHEINIDKNLNACSREDLMVIVNFQNARISDLNYKFGKVDDMLERVFRLNILKESKLKLDMCSYMSAKRGVTNGKKTRKEETSKSSGDESKVESRH